MSTDSNITPWHPLCEGYILFFQTFSYEHLSAGELLRSETNSESTDGNLIDDYIKQGKIVPVEITCRLLEKV